MDERCILGNEDRLIRIGSGMFCRVQDLEPGDVIKLIGKEYTVERLAFTLSGDIRLITTPMCPRWVFPRGEEVTVLRAKEEEGRIDMAKRSPEEAIDAKIGKLLAQTNAHIAEMRRLYTIEKAARIALKHLNWMDSKGALTREEEPMLQGLREAFGEENN